MSLWQLHSKVCPLQVSVVKTTLFRNHANYTYITGTVDAFWMFCVLNDQGKRKSTGFCISTVSVWECRVIRMRLWFSWENANNTKLIKDKLHMCIKKQNTELKGAHKYMHAGKSIQSQNCNRGKHAC